jgi:AraC-like DNA-binding protein
VAAPALVPVERTEMESSDPTEVEDLVRRRYFEHRPRLLSDSREFGFRSRSATAGGLTVDRITYAASMAFRTDPLETVVVVHLAEGQFDVSTGRRSCRADRGDTVLYPLAEPLDVLLDRMTYQVVQFPVAALVEAATRLEVDAPDIRFVGMAPVSPAMNRHWAATVAYLEQCFAGPEPAASHPLLLAGALETAASAVLAAFPNTTMAADRPAVPSRVDPAVVRRAVEYIDANAGEPITLDEIAAAAGARVRGLRAGFSRHRGTTPMAYLRQVRLEHAHRDLLAADPARGDTVAATARRWGFADPARFAAEYLEAYGRLPGHTLLS